MSLSFHNIWKFECFDKETNELLWSYEDPNNVTWDGLYHIIDHCFIDPSYDHLYARAGDYTSVETWYMNLLYDDGVPGMVFGINTYSDIVPDLSWFTDHSPFTAYQEYIDNGSECSEWIPEVQSTPTLSQTITFTGIYSQEWVPDLMGAYLFGETSVGHRDIIWSIKEFDSAMPFFPTSYLNVTYTINAISS